MANCVALKTIRAAGDLSLEDEATLREYHYRMGDLDKSLGAGNREKPFGTLRFDARALVYQRTNCRSTNCSTKKQSYDLLL